MSLLPDLIAPGPVQGVAENCRLPYARVYGLYDLSESCRFNILRFGKVGLRFSGKIVGWVEFVNSAPGNKWAACSVSVGILNYYSLSGNKNLQLKL